MSQSDPGVHVLSVTEALLSPAVVAKLESELRRSADGQAIVIDCSALARASGQGLSALLELAASSPRALALAGLSRPLMRAAIQAGLAERFAIYTSCAAFARSRARAETSSCER